MTTPCFIKPNIIFTATKSCRSQYSSLLSFKPLLSTIWNFMSSFYTKTTVSFEIHIYRVL